MTTTTESAEVRAAPLHDVLTEREELVARTLRAENRVLREALEVFDHYVDPLDAYREEGELWNGAGNLSGQAGTLSYGGFRSEAELAAARNACRALAMSNEFAINGHENRISYLVGSGHRYQVVPRKGAASDGWGVPNREESAGSPLDTHQSHLESAQAILDEFVRDSSWHRRQQEIVRRRDRDGEAFLRFFLDTG
jgi:hypothetical protein